MDRHNQVGNGMNWEDDLVMFTLLLAAVYVTVHLYMGW